MSQTASTIDEIEMTKKQLIDIINCTIQQHNLFLNEKLIQSLISHLAIALIRIKTNSYIPLSQGQITSYQNNNIYSIAADLCNKIAGKYNIDFPESEQALVAMYLSKVNVLDIEFNSGFDLLDSDVITILKNTINNIYIKCSMDLKGDDKLLIALGLHLTPAIDRLMNDDQIDNPLTDKIKERYTQAYEMAQILNDAVDAMYQRRFTDEETAYFALHFALSLKHHHNKTV